MENISYKIVIIGDSRVGKTSIIGRYVKNNFKMVSENDRTVNACNMEKMIQIKEKTIKLNIWDTAGEEKYRALAPLYYREADGVILVFDLSNYDSFLSMTKWFEEVKNHAKPELKIVLCGNKCDLKKQVNFDDAQKLGSSFDAPYIAVSALSGINLGDLFTTLSKQIYLSRCKSVKLSTRKSIRIGELKANDDIKKSGCC